MKYLYNFILIGLRPASLKKLHSTFPDFRTAWTASVAELRQANLTENTIQKIVTARTTINPDEEWRKFQETNLKILTINDSEYPDLLRKIGDAPFALFCQGNIQLLRRKQLAVVGTRRHSEYGKMVVQKIIPQINQAGIVITSGLAQGIDSLAHQSVVEQQGETIAVLGAGIIQAQKNYQAKKLISEIIAQNGLIVSEYPPLAGATKFTFPARNRIVSGLSLGVLVVEAGEKSGTLITANYALEQNREVFAIPGNIFSDKSIGTHLLLKQGAQLVTSANDILEALNFSPIQKNILEEIEITLDDPQEERIYQKLSFDPITIDKLSKICKMNSMTIASKLSLLELKGLVKNIGGGRFIKI